jgi:crotonobetainyl-CoA:carnitine CoA-transferase CaiB-like acyl-CoA transferase
MLPVNKCYFAISKKSSINSFMTALDLIKSLREHTRQPTDIISELSLIGSDPVLPSSFHVDKMAQTVIGLTALGAAEIWRQRTGEIQSISVDINHAAAEFRSDRYQRVDGEPTTNIWDPIAGIYQCGDGKWARIHTNFEHHRKGILKILKCENDRSAVEAIISKWSAEDLETTVSEVGFLAVMVRSSEEWLAHAQGQAIAAQPLLSIEKIGDAPPTAFAKDAERPLSDIRVLDLTRIIAGPVGDRTLAAHGADVLRITSPNLPGIGPLDIDNGRGKRSTHVDLRTDEGSSALRSLLKEADIFVQGYRPDAIANLGFSPANVAAQKPGIVYGSLSAYGTKGPWAKRRGYDSLVQTVSGINAAEAEAAGESAPKHLPNQALDHATGYLLAYGIMAALLRRSQEGGSWHVQVSLAQTSHWLQSLGRVENGLALKDQQEEDVAEFLETTVSGYGELSSIRHAGKLSVTPAHWAHPSVPLGTHPPNW